jgi:hypothetical protein
LPNKKWQHRNPVLPFLMMHYLHLIPHQGQNFVPECDFLPKLGPRIVGRIVYGGKVGHSGASVTLFFRSGRFWGFLPFPDSAMAAGFPDTPAVGLAVFVVESVALGL